MENRIKSITANNSTRITSLNPTIKETAGRLSYRTVSNEIHVPDDVYRQLAGKLKELIETDCPDYLPDIEVEVNFGTCRYVLAGSMLLYWEMFVAPDGECLQFKDIIPVWWDLKTFVTFGLLVDEPETECPNDAQFNKIKEHLIFYHG